MLLSEVEYVWIEYVENWDDLFDYFEVGGWDEIRDYVKDVFDEEDDWVRFEKDIVDVDMGVERCVWCEGWIDGMCFDDVVEEDIEVY